MVARWLFFFRGSKHQDLVFSSAYSLVHDQGRGVVLVMLSWLDLVVGASSSGLAYPSQGIVECLPPCLFF